MLQQINKLIADALRTHAAPLPDYARSGEFTNRFVEGNVKLGDRPCDNADLSRLGGYCTYAHRTTIVPLEGGLPSVTYWSPTIYFLADNAELRPELAMDGDPFRRNVRVVPLSSGGSAKAIKRRVFAHLEKPFERLVAFYASTGQRWEVIVERERRRCKAEGQPFDMPELPLDPKTLS